MSRRLARLAGFTAGYLFFVVLERLVLVLEQDALRRAEDQAEPEPFDASDVVERHRECCWGAA